ncbi:MAG TPA: PDZ domain-containing protein [Longimicrobiales bacterium]|nr:PDZ domain-containing protein [Longimicrobiales bacterium]
MTLSLPAAFARRLVVAALVLAAGGAPAAAQVTYDLSFPDAAHHEARVEVLFENLPPGPLEVRMSRSSPGRYALHEFAKNVYGVRATDAAGEELPVTRPDPHQWNVHNHGGTVRFAYTLYGDRTDGTYTGIDATHAHLNMPASLAWARGRERQPVVVRFNPPEGSLWRVATQLVPTEDPYTFRAPDLAYLMDSPTELSDFALREWTLAGPDGGAQTVRLAVHHLGTDAEVDAYADMVKKVVAEQHALWGEMPAFDHGAYTFIADYLPWASGDGMEHRNSTILTSSASLASNALGLLGTASHELFHAWSVERLRPRSLEPFDFERANMSDALWFAEGFTSYYDDLFIRRAGLIDDARYAAGISGGLSAVITSPARRFFGPAGMSMQAPFTDAAVSVDPTNRDNTFISYYTYGAVLGLGLDLLLRSRFPGLTLDDYMRALWIRFGAPERPYTLRDLEETLGEVTGDRGFAGDFFRRHVHASELPPYEELLGYAGFLLRTANPGQPVLGQARLAFDVDGAVVVEATRIGSPLYGAGIDRGDRLLELDGRALTGAPALAAALERHRPGDAVTLRVRGRSGERAVRLTLAEDPRLEVVPFEATGLEPTAEMRAFRNAWLGSRVEVR